MKVSDIKLYNSKQVEVTNLLILNTDYVKEFITKRIQNCLNYDQLCEVFKEVREVYIKDVGFSHIEFDFKNKVLNVIYTYYLNDVNLKVYLK